MLYACRVDLLGVNGYAFDDKRYSHHANCDYDLLPKRPMTLGIIAFVSCMGAHRTGQSIQCLSKLTDKNQNIFSEFAVW